MNRVIHWFRRDLRVTDNTALSEAARQAEQVIPVFVLEEAFRTGPDVGAARLAFLLSSLESLRKDLERLGYPLIIRNGRSPEVIPRLAQELGAEAVFANRRYEPWKSPAHGQGEYPQRIVQHEVQREKCLAMFASIKRQRGEGLKG